MRRNMKKLVAATALLLISALMLGTATFAWFAMNTNSVADGLQVEAYTDSNFLQISKDGTTYDTDITYDTNNTGLLRLATHKFLKDSTIVTVEVDEIDDGSRYDGNGVYYKAVTGDSGTNYIYANNDLVHPTSTAGLLKNIKFELVVSDTKVSGTFYERVGNEFHRVELSAESAKGCYKPYYFKACEANDVVDVNTTYYTENGTVVNGLQNGDSATGYFVKTYAAPTPEAQGAEYDGSSDYYKLEQYTDAQGGVHYYYYKVGNLTLGSVLDGYYTLEEEEVTIEAGDTSNGNTVYYLKSALHTKDNNSWYDYSCIGTIEEGTVLSNYLFFGRAYSSDIVDGQANNTLDIINPDGVDGDAPINYYLNQTLYLRQAEGTNHATNLSVKNIKIGGATNELSDALRVLLVASSSAAPNEIVTVLYDAGEDTYNGQANGYTLFETLLGNEAETVKVDVYIYFDGMDPIANNADVAGAVLNGQSIGLEFAIDELPYNQ